MLDLRGNGGGLLSEAVLVSSIFIEDGRIVSVRGPQPSRTAPRTPWATRSRRTCPVVVLVDSGSASASEIVTGALRDRGRATVVGTRTYGKGLVQEVIDLSNGGVLDLTVANYYLPERQDDHHARAPAAGEGRRTTRTPSATRRCPSRSTPFCGKVRDRRRRAARRAPAGRAARGRAREARPLPGGRAAVRPGPRTAVERGGAGPGDLVLVGSGKRGARVVRVLGRPDRARDVVEGLMLDRGLHRNYGRAAEAEAGGGHGGPVRRRRPRGPHRAAHVHDRPRRRQGLRRRDLGHAARTAACALWVHIADVTAYLRPGGPLEREATRRATSVYVPGAVEPMLPEVLSNRACSLRPGEEKLAVTVEMEMDGAEVRKVAFHRSRVRSDARLTYGQVDEVFAGPRARRGALGRAARGRARGGARAPRAPRLARDRRRPSRRSSSTARAT